MEHNWGITGKIFWSIAQKHLGNLKSVIGSGLRYTHNRRLSWSLNFIYCTLHRHNSCCTVYRCSAASGSPHNAAYICLVKNYRHLYQNNTCKKNLCLNETWSSEFLVMWWICRYTYCTGQRQYRECSQVMVEKQIFSKPVLS